MTEFEYEVCERQQEFFELIQKRKVNFYTFTPMFLRSDFCNRELDADYSWFHSVDIMEWEELLMDDCPIIPDIFQKDYIPLEAAGWIGFVYRHLHYATGLSSRELAKRVPVERLIIAYQGLHTVDEDMAAEIIIEDFNLSITTKKDEEG